MVKCRLLLLASLFLDKHLPEVCTVGLVLCLFWLIPQMLCHFWPLLDLVQTSTRLWRMSILAGILESVKLHQDARTACCTTAWCWKQKWHYNVWWKRPCPCSAEAVQIVCTWHVSISILMMQHYNVCIRKVSILMWIPKVQNAWKFLSLNFKMAKQVWNLFSEGAFIVICLE